MELTDQQETSSHWDNKINALWVSMATGGPSCSSGPACCRMAHLCQVSLCFKTNKCFVFAFHCSRDGSGWNMKQYQWLELSGARSCSHGHCFSNGCCPFSLKKIHLKWALKFHFFSRYICNSLKSGNVFRKWVNWMSSCGLGTAMSLLLRVMNM
jgi:hypothetical protein